MLLTVSFFGFLLTYTVDTYTSRQGCHLFNYLPVYLTHSGTTHKTPSLQPHHLTRLDPWSCERKSHHRLQTRWMGCSLCLPNTSRSWRNSTCWLGASHSTIA